MTPVTLLLMMPVMFTWFVALPSTWPPPATKFTVAPALRTAVGVLKARVCPDPACVKTVDASLITQTAPTITTVTTTPPPVVAPPPPAPPVQASPVRKEFKPLQRVNPAFPRQALQQGITGRVVAWVYVAPNGSVSNVEIKQSSNRLFDREVVRALSQWRFNPEPVGFIGEYEIVFNLTD